MIEINVKGLVQFMLGDDVRRRSVLAAFKFPEVAQAPRRYYREALPTIRALVTGEISLLQMTNRADILTKEAAAAPGGRQVRLLHNARAIIEFAEKFGNRGFTGERPQRLSYLHGNVKVAVHPELWVREKHQLRILKLELGAEGLEQRFINTMAQLIFHAARQHNLEIAPSQAGVLELASGEVFTAKRFGTRLENRVNAAIENIEALWPTIKRRTSRTLRNTRDGVAPNLTHE